MNADSTITVDRHLPDVSEDTLHEVCQMFKRLADETRLRILSHLSREGELNVTELCERLEQAQPAVSHHLALMRHAGIIELRRDGKHNYYSIADDHFREFMRSLVSNRAGKKPRLRFDDFVLRCAGVEP